MFAIKPVLAITERFKNRLTYLLILFRDIELFKIGVGKIEW